MLSAQKPAKEALLLAPFCRQGNRDEVTWHKVAKLAGYKGRSHTLEACLQNFHSCRSHCYYSVNLSLSRPCSDPPSGHPRAAGKKPPLPQHGMSHALDFLHLTKLVQQSAVYKHCSKYGRCCREECRQKSLPARRLQSPGGGTVGE